MFIIDVITKNVNNQAFDYLRATNGIRRPHLHVALHISNRIRSLSITLVRKEPGLADGGTCLCIQQTKTLERVDIKYT